MLKQFFAGAIICAATPAVALSDSDSTAHAIDLQEIVVKAPPRIGRADKNVIIPPADAVQASTSGRDLIGRLHIPRVAVNPLSGEIGMSGGGTVVITINGVAGTSAELAAIRPDDIVRVEHIDNPGPRYPDATMVLNVVTRRHTAGATASAEMLNAFRRGGEADLDNIALALARGKSQLAFTGQLMRLKRDNWTRDYTETRRYAGSTVEITETGAPTPIELSDLSGRLSYSIADGSTYIFNAALGYVHNSVPRSEEADRTTVRRTSGSELSAEIREHMDERSSSPSLDLYGQYRFGASAITANAVATYIESDNGHTYRSTPSDGTAPTSVSSTVSGRKYSLIAELAYSYASGAHRVEAGARHLQACARNSYRGDVQADVAMRSAHTTLYARWFRTAGPLSLMASLGATRYFNSQDATRLSQWIVAPAAAVAWTPMRAFSLRYRMELKGKMPALAELSDVEQPIEPGYVRRGNPALKAFRVLDHEFSASWQWRWLGLDLAVPATHEFNPVMESVVSDGHTFVRMPFNQKSFTHIGACLALTLRPWADHVVLSLMPTIDHYRSRGPGFSCARTLKNLHIDAEINWHGWQLSYNTLTGYANYMYGTRLMRERNMSMLMAGYRAEAWSVKLGVIDPFIKTYWMETREMSPVLGSVSRALSASPTYFAVQLNLRLSYGRHSEERLQDMDNSDTDSGLLKGVK